MNQQGRTLPSDYYYSPARYQLEEAAYLTRSWLYLAHESELQQPGETIVQDLLGRSVLARRGKDRRLHAFYNVCRHRAGPLAPAGKHMCPTIKCLYHGWQYDDNGSLTATPRYSEATSMNPDPSEHSLFPIRIEAWNGFLFINFDNHAPSLLSQLGDLPDLLDRIDFAAFEVRDTRSFSFSCNWKLYVENWLESYHLPWLHKSLSQDVQVSAYRVEIGDRVVTHRAPARSDDPVYGGLWVWLAPCIAWNFYDKGLSLERMLPIGPDKTRVDYTFMFRKDVDESETAAAIKMCTDVTREDGEISEVVHRNLQSTPFSTGPLSPVHEMGINYFHELIEGQTSIEVSTAKRN